MVHGTIAAVEWKTRESWVGSGRAVSGWVVSGRVVWGRVVWGRVVWGRVVWGRVGSGRVGSCERRFYSIQASLFFSHHRDYRAVYCAFCFATWTPRTGYVINQ